MKRKPISFAPDARSDEGASPSDIPVAISPRPPSCFDGLAVMGGLVQLCGLAGAIYLASTAAYVVAIATLLGGVLWGALLRAVGGLGHLAHTGLILQARQEEHLRALRRSHPLATAAD